MLPTSTNRTLTCSSVKYEGASALPSRWLRISLFWQRGSGMTGERLSLPAQGSGKSPWLQALPAMLIGPITYLAVAVILILRRSFQT